jgi:hypothetical protein
MRNDTKLLSGGPEGKRSLHRFRLWWEDHIKMDLKEIEHEVVKSIHFVKDMA